MILNPDIQRRAREEIDNVVGSRRLPSFQDRPNMPYVDALVKELLRWHPVGRIGMSYPFDLCWTEAHGCDKESLTDVYKKTYTRATAFQKIP